MAPEQIRGDIVDGRADLYALGCVLYECLAGRPPFTRPTEVATIYAHLEEPPPAASDIQPELPKAIDAVLAKALAKNPDDRHPSCRALIHDARDALGIAQPRRSPWPLAAAAVGVALIAAALAAYTLTRSPATAPPDPTADTLLRIDPATNTIAQRTPVGHQSSGVAVGGGHVWVTNLADGTITLVDPVTGKVRTIAGQGAPTGIAVAAGLAVVADGTAHSLTAFDATTGTRSFKTTLRGPSNGTLQIAGGRSGSWFADAAAGIAGKVDNNLTVGTPSTQVSVPADDTSLVSAYFSFDGLTVGEGAIWVAGDAREKTVWRLNPATGRALAIPLGFVPGAIAAGAGAIWVTSLLDDTVSRIDPASNRVTATDSRRARSVPGSRRARRSGWRARSTTPSRASIRRRTRWWPGSPFLGRPRRWPSASAVSGSLPEGRRFRHLAARSRSACCRTAKGRSGSPTTTLLLRRSCP